MMAFKFNKECKEKELHGGEQYIFKFQNGFGASVVSHSFSYGGSKGLFELAVLDSSGSLTYKTEITNDVIGNLNETQVEELLNKIKELKSEV